MFIGITELLVIVFITCVFNGLAMWGVIDALLKPESAWGQAGHSKILWVVLQAASLLVCGLGLIKALVYTFAIRPAVVRHIAALQPPHATSPSCSER